MRPKLLTILILLQLGTAHSAVVEEGSSYEMTDNTTTINRSELSPQGAVTTLATQRSFPEYAITFNLEETTPMDFNTRITMLNDTPGVIHLGNTTSVADSNVEVINLKAKNDVTIEGGTKLITRGDFGDIGVYMEDNTITIASGHVDRISRTDSGVLNKLEISEDGRLGETSVGREIKANEAQITGRTDNILLNTNKLILNGEMTLDTSTYEGTRGGVVNSAPGGATAEIVIGREGVIELVDHEDTRDTEYSGVLVKNGDFASITNNGFISATSTTTARERNFVAGIALTGGAVTNNGEINSTQFALISASGATEFTNNGTVTGAVGRNASRIGRLTFANYGTWNVRSNPQLAGKETIIDTVQNLGLITTTTANGDQKLISRQLINAGEIDVRENTLTLLGDYRGVDG
ncbi:TPA: hypothetical protein RU587_005101, partial [Salmonella enterica]|nr:hypothetical protein [Salmonella enterica]